MTSSTKALASLGSALLSSRLPRALNDLSSDDVLGWTGLTRRRTSFWQRAAWFGAGAAVGAVAALLLAPSTGRDTRRRIRKGAERLGDAAEAKWNEAATEMIETRDQILKELHPLDDRGAALPPTPPAGSTRSSLE